jgi:hypothetical protein
MSKEITKKWKTRTKKSEIVDKNGKGSRKKDGLIAK